MAEPPTNGPGWPLPVFGLTGTIASGKSTLATALEDRGACLVDADRLGHRLLWKGRSAHRQVVELFGRSILGRRGGIDRARLGALVFADAEARARLEAVLHPAIVAAARRKVRALARERFCIVIFEAALLVESGFHVLVDDTIVVLAGREAILDRLVRLRGLDRSEARRRLAAQWTGRPSGPGGSCTTTARRSSSRPGPAGSTASSSGTLPHAGRPRLTLVLPAGDLV
jgi:dephospho-CoA kinase